MNSDSDSSRRKEIYLLFFGYFSTIRFHCVVWIEAKRSLSSRLNETCTSSFLIVEPVVYSFISISIWPSFTSHFRSGFSQSASAFSTLFFQLFVFYLRFAKKSSNEINTRAWSHPPLFSSITISRFYVIASIVKIKIGWTPDYRVRMIARSQHTSHSARNSLVVIEWWNRQISHIIYNKVNVWPLRITARRTYIIFNQFLIIYFANVDFPWHSSDHQ